MKRLLLLIPLLLCGCHYPWQSVFKTTPETKQVQVEREPVAKPTRKAGKKYRIIIRRIGGVASVPEIQEVPRDE